MGDGPLIGGKPSQRLRHALENTLFLYNGLAKIQAKKTDNNFQNFKIEKLRLVGSGFRNNRINSDLDFLLVAPDLDGGSAKHLNLIMQYILFCDRPKQEAVDTYVFNEDIYADRGGIDLLPFAKDLMEKYNPK